MGDFLTKGYCFPYCFLEILGHKALMEEDRFVMGIPQSPTRENPDWCCQYVHSFLNLKNPRCSPVVKYENLDLKNLKFRSIHPF